MKNNLVSLNDYLFEELERLNDDETMQQEENFKKEMNRSKAISQVAKNIIDNANVMLEAKKYVDEYCPTNKEMPKLLGVSDD